MVVYTAQKNMKTFLDTYLTLSITEDDGVSQASCIVAYDLPDYPLHRVFIDKAVDVVFSVGQASSKPVIDDDHYQIGYDETVPITVFCMDKAGLTAAKTLEKAEADLRHTFEDHWAGSIRKLATTKPQTVRIGGTYFWAMQYDVNYLRDKT
jgi:hypothetical protein